LSHAPANGHPLEQGSKQGLRQDWFGNVGVHAVLGGPAQAGLARMWAVAV